MFFSYMVLNYTIFHYTKFVNSFLSLQLTCGSFILSPQTSVMIELFYKSEFYCLFLGFPICLMYFQYFHLLVLLSWVLFNGVLDQRVHQQT